MGAFSRGIRNIYRNKPRALIIILILGLSVGLFATMLQASASTQVEIEKLKTEFENLIVVRAAGATEMGAGAELLQENIVEEVERIPNIEKIEKYLLKRTTSEEFEPAISIVVGVVPGDTVRLATHGSIGTPKIIAGRGLQKGDEGKNVALIGRVFAESRGLLRVEDALGKSAPFGAFELNGTEFQIVGLFESGFAFGDNQVVIPYDVAQKTLGLEGRITSLWITVDSAENTKRVTEEIRNRLGNKVDVIVGLLRVELVVDTLGGIQASSFFGAILAMVVSALVVLFVMVLATRERTREIGVLKAIGASNGDVARQFIFETMALAAVGGVIGLFTFSTFAPTLVSRLLGLSQTEAPFGGMGESPIAGIEVGFNLSPGVIGYLLGMVLFLGVLGSMYPVLRALRMKPAEAMRHE